MGLSRRTLNVRQDEHLTSSIIDKKYAFHKALAAQRCEGFAWFVLQSGLSVEASADVERYYIKHMKTRWQMEGHTGYNMTNGGEVGGGSGNMGVADEVTWCR